MANKMSFTDYYDILLKKTDELKSELEDLIVTEIEDIPSLNEIKDTDIRYKSYSKAVKSALQVSRILSNSYFTKDAVVRVKQKLQKDTTTPPKIITSWLRDVDFLLQDIDGVLQSAKSFKEGVDNLNRFYQNACYMFGGIFEVKTPI